MDKQQWRNGIFQAKNRFFQFENRIFNVKNEVNSEGNNGKTLKKMRFFQSKTGFSS